MDMAVNNPLLSGTGSKFQNAVANLLLLVPNWD